MRQPARATSRTRAAIIATAAIFGVLLALYVVAPAVVPASAQENAVETVAGGGSLPSIGAVNAILANPNDVAYLFLSSTQDRIFFRQNKDTPAELVAGNGFHGFGGDGGDARHASFDLGVAVGDIAWSIANERLVYVADFYDNRVREIDRFTHTIRTVFGTGQCPSASVAGNPLTTNLCSPQSVAVDLDGTMYVLTYDEIWRVRNGVAQQVAVTGTKHPWGDVTFSLGRLQIDTTRRKLYISHGEIAVMDLDTGVISPYLTPEVGPNFNVIALNDLTGDLYYLDGPYDHPLIKRRSPGALSSETVAGGGSALSPFGLNTRATDANFSGIFALAVRAGGLLIAEGSGYIDATDDLGNIITLEGNGHTSYCGDGGPATGACLNVPSSVIVNPNGSLEIADGENDAIRTVSAAGLIDSTARGVFGANARLLRANDGSIFVASSVFHDIYQRFPDADSHSPVAGSTCATGPTCPLGDGGPASAASFNTPMGMAQDRFGNLFVADSGNHRIRRISNGVITTVAGDGTPDGHSADGAAASSTSFDTPVDLAFDTDGSLLVVERAPSSAGKSRVRRIFPGPDGAITGDDPNEIVATVAGTLESGSPGDTDNVPATSVMLTTLSSVAVNADTIFLADESTSRIRAIDKVNGLITTFAGGGSNPDDRSAPADTAFAVHDFQGAPNASLPRIVLADIGGISYLYIVDRGNNRVRRVAIGPTSASNSAPVVTTSGPVVVAATSPQGAMAVVGASANDPDGDPLTFSWEFAGQTATGAFVALQFPLGTSLATVTVDDGHAHQVQATVTVIVRGAAFAAGDVSVHIPAVYDTANVKRAGFIPDVRLDLTGAAAPGVATLNVLTNMQPAPPAGYQFGSPPYIYDINATQPVTAMTVCIDTTGMTFADRAHARLFFLNGDSWADVTAAGDASHVCGTLPAFGRVAIFTPTADGSGAETLAGTGAYPDYVTNPDGSVTVPDGGIANQTPLLAASGVAIDRQRNVLYFSDFNRLRRVDLATHLISTVAGDGGYPELAFDSVLGAYQVANPDDQRLRMPTRLALDAQGRVYIAEDCRVLRFDPASSTLTRFAGDGICLSRGDGLPADHASIMHPSGLAFDAAGNLFIGDIAANVVRRVDAVTGLISTVAGDGTATLRPGQPARSSGVRPFDLAVGRNGDLYVVQFDQYLLRIATGGDGTVDGGPGETVSVVNACALSSCPALPFDGDGGPVASATLERLYSIAAEASGDLLVGSFDRNRIRRIAAGADGVVDGIVSTAAGYDATNNDPPTGSAFDFHGENFALSSAIALPAAIAADPAGGFVWADNTSPRVRHAGVGSASSPNGADLGVSVAASPTEVLAGQNVTYTVTVTNNGPATSTGASLSMPIASGMTIVSAGNLTAPIQLCVVPFLLPGGSVTCGLQDLVPGQQAVLRIEVSASTAGTLSAHFVVAGSQDDPQPANNGMDVDVHVLESSVSVVVNEVVHVADDPQPRPAVMLNIGESVHVTDDPQPRPAVMLNVDESIHVTDDPQIQILRPDLSIIKRATDGVGTISGTNPVVLETGAIARFDLYVNNGVHGGAGPTTGPVTVTDTLDPRLTFLPSASDSQCSAVGQVVTCTAPTALNPGEFYVFIVRAVVASDAAGVGQTVTIQNQATVATANEADPSDNTSNVVTISVNGPNPPTAMTLVATPNPAEFGQPVTFTATVSSANGTPAGEVIFRYRAGSVFRFLTAPVPLVNGIATLQLPGFFLGDTDVSAEYADNATYFGSQASLTMHVTKAVTHTALSSSRNPSLTTGPSVFIAIIDTASTVPPTGKVEFTADGVVLCRSTVFMRGARPTASCGGAPLAAGSHSVSAAYLGADAFESSTAPPVTQVVRQGAYFMLDLGFAGEAVALSPHGWVAGNSLLKSSLASSALSSAYVHDGTTTGTAQSIPSLGGSKTIAVGVDDSGRVAGSATTATGATHVFLFDGTTTSDHHNPAFGGLNSRATAMNAGGTIVGFADTASGFHAFVDVRGGAVDLGTLPGGASSAAVAISELGHIVGASTVGDGTSHATLFLPVLTSLSTFEGASSGAVSVNDAGEAVGSLTPAGGVPHAFVYADGVMQDLGAALGSQSLATAINDAGQVSGTFVDSSGATPETRGFLRSLDVSNDLGLAAPVALNNAGEVVTTASGHIFVRTGGTILTIGGTSSGGVSSNLPPFVNATAMNDEGRIAGSIVLGNGPHAVVWIPVSIASLTLDPAHGRSGATAPLTATLSDPNGPAANKLLHFRINGADAGSARTDASGHASVPASLAGIAEGVYAGGVDVSFGGDETLSGTFASADLTVGPAGVTITWPQPAPIVQGTALSAVHLNATANVPGTFVYSPPMDTRMRQAGAGQVLSVTFRPDDPSYGPATATVTIDVTPAPLGVTLLTPLAGAKAFVGVPFTIRWQASGFPTSFDVELSTGAGSFQPIATCANLPGSATSCDWTPALSGRAPGGVNAKVRVIAHDSSQTAIDTSGAFTIAPGAPTLRVTSPNTALRWAVGTTRSITWVDNLGVSGVVSVELSRDGGNTWEILAASVQNTTATQGTLDWAVTGPTTTAALIRVAWADSSASDSSNVPFAIESPAITVTSPNGGEQWFPGTSHNITWTHNLGAGESVGIDVSRDGGVTWSTIAASVNNTGNLNGQFNWLVTAPASAQARVRVRWLHFFQRGFGAVADDSDGDFRIGSLIHVTAPNTATTWAAGSRQQVTWTHSYGTPPLFDVDVSTDGGATWGTAAQNVSTSGSTYGATVIRLPGVVTTQALVRVSPAGRPQDGDVSDVPFKLVALSVSLGAPGGQTCVIDSRCPVTVGHNLGSRVSSSDFSWSVSFDGGTTWRSASVNVTVNPGGNIGASWWTTGPVTTHARLRVSALFGAARAESADFTIIPAIHVTSPNTSVLWLLGSVHAITWTHNGGTAATFDVALSPDGGTTWFRLAQLVPAATATTGSYTWTVGGTPTTQALIRVSPTGSPADGDTSDVPFTVGITATSP